MTQDPYKILGVSPDASDEEIKRAYRRLAKEYHPDRNPGNPEAAQKMQQINAAYEQIKNPDKAGQSAGYGYSPHAGGYQSTRAERADGDPCQQAAYHYIRYGRFREALNALDAASQRDARWYYLSAIAHHGLGNQVTALEHIRRAVSMEPDNPEYLNVLNQIEHGGAAYRRQAGSYRSFSGRSDPCSNLCLCLCLQRLCCGWPCC